MGIVLVLMETIFDYWYVMDYIGGMLNPNGKENESEELNEVEEKHFKLKIFESFIEKNQQNITCSVLKNILNDHTRIHTGEKPNIHSKESLTCVLYEERVFHGWDLK